MKKVIILIVVVLSMSNRSFSQEIDFENFDFYHHVDDEFDKMDTAHMVNFIQSFIPVVEKMANAATKEIILKK